VKKGSGLKVIFTASKKVRYVASSYTSSISLKKYVKHIIVLVDRQEEEKDYSINYKGKKIL